MSLTKVSFSMIQGDYVNALDYGVSESASGAANATALQNAFNSEKVVFLPQGTYALAGNNVLSIDVSKTALVSPGAVIDATAVTGYVANVFSTATYANRPLQSFNKNAITGVSFSGTNSVGNFCLYIGNTGASYEQSNDMVFERCGFKGFEKQIVFGDNGWRTKFVNCGFEAGAYPIYYQQPSNAGEVMEFDHCWMVDWTVGPVIVSGNFLFTGCSFIGGATTPMTFDQNARVDFVGCNFEDQANGDFWLALNGVSDVSITGGQLLVNSTRTKPLIYMASGARLSLSGVALPLYGANLQYETNAATGQKVRSIVQGQQGFRVNAVGCNDLAGTLANYTIQAVLGGSNALYNCGVETGNTNGWTLTQYGGSGATIAASSSYPKNGTYGLLVTAPAGVGALVTQTIDVSSFAGRSYCFGFWARAVSGTGTVGLPQILFKASDGSTVRSDALTAVLGTDTTYAWYARNDAIPDGAVTAVVTIEAQQLAGGCSVAYDDVIFQVI